MVIVLLIAVPSCLLSLAWQLPANPRTGPSLFSLTSEKSVDRNTLGHVVDGTPINSYSSWVGVPGTNRSQ